MLTKSPGSRHAARQAENELDLVFAQLREEQQSLLDKKQLLADALREKQHLLNISADGSTFDTPLRSGAVDGVRVGDYQREGL